MLTEEDKASQDEEIESLQSIYLEDEIKIWKTEDGCWKVLVLVNVELPEDYQVRYASSLKDLTGGLLDVQHLPPIRLNIRFTHNYPSQQPPKVYVTCLWLTTNNRLLLHDNLRALWGQNEGFPIVYTWVEYLKTEALAATGNSDKLDLVWFSQRDLIRQTLPENQPGTSRKTGWNRPRAKKTSQRPRRPVVETIVAYNVEKEKESFLKSFHPCEICFVEKLGKESTVFEPCRHIFCRECLEGYFTVLVNEGAVCAVKCPAYKCDSEATQKQVREVLPPELFDKYDSALLSTMLDTMTDIVYCPRPLCQYPVTWEKEECMAVCPHCRYAFCIFCRMVYHGVEPCKFSAEERRKIVESYQKGTEEDKRGMEARYGKKQLENLVNNTLSEFWLKDNGKRCPKCNIVIEKSDGCNKMTCFRCQTFFCWLCGNKLNSSMPYVHFLDPKSPCYKKLFLFVEEMENEWEMEEWVGEDSGSEDLEAGDSDSDGDL